MMMDSTKADQTVAMLEHTLKQSVMNITFTKKDGTTRVMRCTKNSSLIPEESMPKPEVDADGNPVVKPVRVMPPQLVVVYDLEKAAWRSFNVTSIQKMEVLHD